MSRAAKHEVVHALCETFNFKSDVFTNESLAVYLSGQYKTAGTVQKISETPSPKKINDMGKTLETFEETGGYIFSGVYIAYLIETQGIEAYKTAVQNKTDFATLINEEDAVKWYLNKFKPREALQDNT